MPVRCDGVQIIWKMLVHNDYMKTNNIYNSNISQIHTNNMKCVHNSNRDNVFPHMLVYDLYFGKMRSFTKTRTTPIFTTYNGVLN
jgi:hypothetical protein